MEIAKLKRNRNPATPVEQSPTADTSAPIVMLFEQKGRRFEALKTISYFEIRIALLTIIKRF